MTAKKKMFSGPAFKSPMCRLSFGQSLFVPRPVGKSKPKYGCTLIFNKTDRDLFEKYLREALLGEWGEKGIERFRLKTIKNPILAGDGPEARDQESGDIKPGLGTDKFFLRVNTGVNEIGESRKPAVWWKDPNEPVTPEEVYSGCYGKAVLNAFTWHFEETNKDGVSFGISGFQKLREGERFGAERMKVEKYHETVEDYGDAPEETRGGAGAGGLFGS